jgi:hypothetical protein
MMEFATHHWPTGSRPESALVEPLGARSVVLVGMMGAGKSSVGRRLAIRQYGDQVVHRALFLRGFHPGQHLLRRHFRKRRA